jgi:hypothetical protein
VSMDATLAKDMSDLGLRSLSIHVDYELTFRGSKLTSAILPVSAVIDLKTTRQHWRNTHAFRDYGSFTTSSEQGPAQTLQVPKLPSSVAPTVRIPAQTFQVPKLPSSVAPTVYVPAQILQVPNLPSSVAPTIYVPEQPLPLPPPPSSVAPPAASGDGSSH